MKKISVIYWSGTGNTEAMAKAIVEGASNGEAEVRLISVDEATVADFTDADAVALGCPSMGAEVLEEDSMEPYVESIESLAGDKPLVLFGSYDWGDGDWMRDWEERMKSKGAKLLAEGLILQLEPDTEGLEACKELGEKLI